MEDDSSPPPPSPQPHIPKPSVEDTDTDINAVKERVGFESRNEARLRVAHDWVQRYILKWVMFGFVVGINIWWTRNVLKILYYSGSHHEGFHLDNNVLITLVSTSIGNYIALVAIVVRHLFPGEKK